MGADVRQKAAYIQDLNQHSRVVPQILSKYVEMRALTRRTEKTKYPILTNLGQQEFELDRSLGMEALQLCRIHLHEVRVVPYLESIEDVIRIREHKYISDFQESIFEWLDRIASGQKNIEAKYRAKIQLANDQIKKLDKWKPLDSPFTLAASLSIGAAEIFTGSFFGFGFAIASACASIHSRQISNEYGYALFKPS